MKQSTIRFNLLLTGLLLLCSMPAVAIGKLDISIDRLENGERLEITPGYGLTINMMPIGKVNRAWLTDKSWMTIANENGACPNGGCGQSRFVYLQRIDKLNFDGLPSAVDGGTLLNLATVTGEILQFHIVRDRDGIPAYTSVYVQPEERKPIAKIPAPTPSLPSPPVSVSSVPPQAVSAKTVDIPSALKPLLEPEIPIHVLVDLEKPTVEDSNEVKPEKKIKRLNRKAAISKVSQPEETQAIASSEQTDDVESDQDSLPEEKNSTKTAIAKSSETTEKGSQEEAPQTSAQAIAPMKELDKSDEIARIDSESLNENPDESVDVDNNQADENDEDEQIEPSSNEVVESAVLAKSNLQTSPAATNQEIASALLRGLHSQRGRREVGRSIHYYKAQDLIYLLKRYPKLTLEQALVRARMDSKVANALIRYGQR